MPRPDDVLQKKVLPIFYVIDTSGSMKGNKIAALNEAMNNSIDILKEKADGGLGVEIKIGVLLFSSGATWKTKNGLVSLEDFAWEDLTAGGVTDLHLALKELGKKLSRSEFLKSDTGFFLPVFIFMSDGAPTDETWKKELEKLNEKNQWFKRGRKIAIAIGEDAELNVLAQVCGAVEAVIQPNDLEGLKKNIVQASVASTMLASQTRMVGDETDGAAIVKAVAENTEDEVNTFEDSDSFESDDTENPSNKENPSNTASSTTTPWFDDNSFD